LVELRAELTDGTVIEIRGNGIEVKPKDDRVLVENLGADLLPPELE